MVSARKEANMSETSSALGADSFGVEVDDFESVQNDGGVGGGVKVQPGEVIGTVDGEEVRYVVDTSPRVADVMGKGINDPPFGEEV
jgi:hypothetical protein